MSRLKSDKEDWRPRALPRSCLRAFSCMNWIGQNAAQNLDWQNERVCLTKVQSARQILRAYATPNQAFLETPA